MKRLLTISIAAIITITLAACGDSSTGPDTGEEDSNEPATYMVSVDKTPSDAGSITPSSDTEYEEGEEDPEEVCEEVARSVSVPALNEEIFEWMKEARDWSDTVRELADDRATDVKQEHQLISETMSNEIYNLRREVLFTLYGQFVDKFE